MVESVCESIYRLWPLAEWTDYTERRYSPKAFLILLVPKLMAVRREHDGLLARCEPVKRMIGLKTELEAWLRRTDQPSMAHHRARSDFKSQGCGWCAPRWALVGCTCF